MAVIYTVLKTIIRGIAGIGLGVFFLFVYVCSARAIIDEKNEKL